MRRRCQLNQPLFLQNVSSDYCDIGAFIMFLVRRLYKGHLHSRRMQSRKTLYDVLCKELQNFKNDNIKTACIRKDSLHPLNFFKLHIAVCGSSAASAVFIGII